MTKKYQPSDQPCKTPDVLICNTKKNLRECHHQLEKAQKIMRGVIDDKRTPDDIRLRCRNWLKGVQ